MKCVQESNQLWVIPRRCFLLLYFQCCELQF